MLNYTKRYFLLLTFSAFCQTAAADWLIEAGIHSGGDDLRQTNTSDTGADDNAGEQFSVAIGGVFNPHKNIELQLTYGTKFNIGLDLFDDGITTFTRSPLNALLFYRTESWRFGGGVTRHYNPEIDVSTTSQTAVNFDDATGSLLEISYYFAESFFVSGRFTFIDYKTQAGPDVIDTEVSGNSFGIIASFRF